ncbi:MAG: ornithine cyclodeaminase family protein [Candidatus Acidiferrales bacterium]
MALFLTEEDVRSVLTMKMALAAVEEAFQRLADGSAVLHLRQRLHLPGKSYLHYMAAGDAQGGTIGMKIYTSSREGLRFLVPLFNAETGNLMALIEADYLGQMRTGAASGIATRLLARANARTVGIVGTGSQARTQLEAVAAVRKLEHIRAYSRDVGRRAKFAVAMSAQLHVPVETAPTGEEAVRDADIVITATAAKDPVLRGEWLSPGTHINAIGANFPDKRELDAEAIRRAAIIVADSREQSKIEAGDLIQVFGRDEAQWAAIVELAEIVSGRATGRSNEDQITLFKSSGIAIEDVTAAAKIYDCARSRGIGREIPMWTKPESERGIRP